MQQEEVKNWIDLPLDEKHTILSNIAEDVFDDDDVAE